MSKFESKLLAVKLRRQGQSITDIARQLNVSKGSVSSWCREVILTESQSQKLFERQVKAGHTGRIIGAERNKQKRLASVDLYNLKGKSTIGKISKRDLMMLGIGIYWGEGVKSRNSATAIVNSDPRIIMVSKKWMEICLNVDPKLFKPYIYINESHEYRSEEILSFWSKTLHLPKAQFLKPIIIKHKNKKVYLNEKQYYGVLSLRVLKGTELKHQILGLIKACSEG